MFKIGDFARLNKVTVKTLRFYDKIGIFKPLEVDNFTGYRCYSAGQIPKLNRIIALKNMGFSLNEISGLLENELDGDGLYRFLENKESEIIRNIAREQEQLSRIEALKKIIAQEDSIMDYHVVLKAVEPMLVASVRDLIPNYSEQGHLWQELGEYIAKYNAKIIPPCFVVYHQNEQEESRIDAEVFEPINIKIPESDRVKVGVFEGNQEMACTVHQGPYEKLFNAYNAVTRWIEENNYEITGPNRELYLKSYSDTGDPNEFITEIQFPVCKM